MTQVAIVALLINAGWLLFAKIPYRIDIEVYRMGGRAWLDGQPLYADGATFHVLNADFECAADATHAFYRDDVIVDADPARSRRVTR